VTLPLDAHLPPSLGKALTGAGHDAIHTSELPAGNTSTDLAIRKAAIEQDRVVVTKDIDFFDRLVLDGAPPKLVLVRTGNLRKGELIGLFLEQIEAIVAGLESSDLVEWTGRPPTE
jgi:predicted nuclease of predicted toxin-antitoxin system